MLDAVPSGALGEDLIEQGTAAAIREMRLREKSKAAIAREDLDIKMVRKWSSEAGTDLRTSVDNAYSPRK